MTNETKVKLRTVQKPDELLYQYFSKKLNAQIKQFGLGRMEKLVTELNRLSDHIEEYCVHGSHKSKFKFSNRVFEYNMNPKLIECTLIGIPELDLLRILKSVQRNRWENSKFENC